MEIWMILCLIAAAMYLFITERFASSVVAMIVLCTLMLVALGGPLIPGFNPRHWVTVTECTSGFSNSAMLSVAGMFVLSAGLQKTGVIAALAAWLHSITKNPALIILGTLLLAAATSAFINNTAAVAVFLPILISSCAKSGTSPSKVLIPLSYASQVGGVCTLIGTSTNLLVASIAEGKGITPFSIFEFTPLGLVLGVAGVVYFLTLGKWLLPERTGSAFQNQEYQVSAYATELIVQENSSLVGQPLNPTSLGKSEDTRLIALRRHHALLTFNDETTIAPGDVLLVETKADLLTPLCKEWGLLREAEQKFGNPKLKPTELGIVEVSIPPRSRIADRSLAEINFADHYDCVVVGMHRAAHRVRPERLAHATLKTGDALLLLGESNRLAKLRADADFLVMDKVQEPSLRQSKRPLAIGIFVLSIIMAASGLVPILFALLLGSIALIVSGCLLIDEAFEAIDWKVILLLACMLPLGKAIENSGAATLLAGFASSAAKPLGPYGALAVIYLVTAVLTEFMSNNATAVLLAPIAISVAAAVGMSPRPLLVAVCFAASTSFCTPVGYQTNAMVQNPGAYRFSDYVRVGLPLNLLFLIISVICIPLFWPF